MAVWERLLQSVSLMKAMPTFSLWPTKLKPCGEKMLSMSLPMALFSSVVRTSSMTWAVRCRVAPEGRVTIASMKP